MNNTEDNTVNQPSPEQQVDPSMLDSQLKHMSLDQLLKILEDGVAKADPNDKNQQGAKALILAIKGKTQEVLNDLGKAKEEINVQHENHIIEQKRLRAKNKEECDDIKIYGIIEIIDNIILPLIDALEACVSMIGNVEQASADSNTVELTASQDNKLLLDFKKAIQMSIYKAIEKLLRYHVHRICPAPGDDFNSSEHMIISTVDDKTLPEGMKKIHECLQHGMKIDHNDGIKAYNRVIRTAMVTVAQNKSAQ